MNFDFLPLVHSSDRHLDCRVRRDARVLAVGLMRLLLAQALPRYPAPMNPDSHDFSARQLVDRSRAADHRLGPELAGDEDRRQRPARGTAGLRAAARSARSRCSSACRCWRRRWWLLRVPLAHRPRAQWGAVARLALTNMIVWHTVVDRLSVQALSSSGRAAILGYSMPIFSALLGHGRCSVTGSAHARPGRRGRRRPGRGAAAGGTSSASVSGAARRRASGMLAVGRGVGAMARIGCAARTIPVPTADHRVLDDRDDGTTLVMTAAVRCLTETRALGRAAGRTPRGARLPSTRSLIFGFAQPLCLVLRSRAPCRRWPRRSISVMLIPVLGTLSAARGSSARQLHWQDFAAMVLMVAGDRRGAAAAASAVRTGRGKPRRDAASRALARFHHLRFAHRPRGRSPARAACRAPAGAHSGRLERRGAAPPPPALDHRCADHKVGHDHRRSCS